MLRTYPLKPHIAYRKWGFSRARTNQSQTHQKVRHQLLVLLTVATPNPSVGTYCPLDRMYTPAVLAGQQGLHRVSRKT